MQLVGKIKMRLARVHFLLAVFIAAGEVFSLNITTDQALEKHLCGETPINSHTVLELSNITHLIRPGNFCLVRDLVNISIVGPAVVKCTGSEDTEIQTGFGFRNITDLSMKEITFDNCGGVLTNESYTFRNVSLIFAGPFLQAVIILNSCFNVMFSGIEVVNYRGYAILSLNVLGNSTFEGIMIHRSYANNFEIKQIEQIVNFTLSGSGMIVYFIDSVFDEYSTETQNNSSPQLIQHFLTIREAIITKNRNIYPSSLVNRSLLNQLKQEGDLLPIPLGGAGGLSIVILQLLYNVQVDVVDSRVIENAGSGAGGLMIAHKSSLNHAVINIQGCLLQNNVLLSQEVGGAGIQILFNFAFERLGLVAQYNNTRLGSHNIEISDTIVRDNTAPGTGGGLSMLSTPQNISAIMVSLRNVSFIGNTAEKGGDSIFARGERSVFRSKSSLFLSLDQVRVDSRMIAGSPVGALTFINLGRVYITGSETNPSIFENGLNSVITAFSTDVYISGTVIFRHNSALIGGALYLQDNSLLFLTEKVNATFQNNSAIESGGAISIEPDRGPHCAVQIVTNDTSFNSSNIIRLPTMLSTLRLNVSFIDNYSKLGRAIHGGQLYDCIGFPDSIVQLPTDDIGSLYDSLFLFQYRNESVSYLTEFRSIPVKLCFCSQKEEDFKCTNNDMEEVIMEIEVTPGKLFTLNVAPVDSAGQPVKGTLETRVSTGELKVGKSSVFHVFGQCEEVAYSLIGVENVTSRLELIMRPENLVISADLHVLPCPIGFSMSNSTGMCDCSPLYREHGLTCDVSTKLIERSRWQWAGVIGDNETQEAAFVSTCPYGYCNFDYSVSVNISDPTDICLGGRTGVLCGQCQEGLSKMFGTTDCGECINFYLFTLLLYALAGILLVCLLFVLKLTVSSGTINGLVFYAQLMGTTLTVVENSPTRMLTVLISLINLDLGFPICFYDGMDELGKMGLQFVFPVYIWLIVGLIILVLNYSDRLQKIFASNICINVLVTLMYLSFAKVIRTFTFILIPAHVQTESGDSSYKVWFFDGSVIYFTGAHVVLVLLSLLFGILSLIYLFGLLLSQWCGLRIGRLTPYLKPVIDAHSAPFKDKFRFWIGLRLLFAGIFIILTITLAAVRFTLLVFLQFVMLFLLTLSQVHLAPFKNRTLNLLDLFFLVNISLYVGTQLYILTFNELLSVLIRKGALYIVEGIFVGSAMVVGLGILVYHIIFVSGLWNTIKRCAKSLKKKKGFVPHREVTTTEVMLSDTISATNPLHQRRPTQSDLYIRLRESLLDED